MSTSYKPALLKAIVRLQRTSPLCVLPLSDVAEEFARLYWSQTIVYHLRQADSLSKEPEVLQALRSTAHRTRARRFDDVPRTERRKLIGKVTRVLKIDVLRRFHATLPAGANPLFSWDGGDTL